MKTHINKFFGSALNYLMLFISDHIQAFFCQLHVRSTVIISSEATL